MLRFCLPAALALMFTPATAQDIDDGGRYYSFDGTSYMTKGAESIAAPGQIGKVTGKGLSGILTGNGFSPIGQTTSGGVRQGKVFSIAGSLVASGTADVSLAGTDRATGTAAADVTIDTSRSYQGVFTQVADWTRLLADLNAFAASQGPGSAIFKDDFRVVDSVLYVSGYATGSDVTLTGDLSLNVTARASVAVVGKVTGTGTATRQLTLSDGSAIAYGTRHLCWMNGVIADTAADVPRLPRPRTCKPYR